MQIRSLTALVMVLVALGQLPEKQSVLDQTAAERRLTVEPITGTRRPEAHRSATIHWQGVPLREAIARLRPLFDEMVFLDRRVDPALRVSLDIDAGSAEQVAAALASGRELGVGRLGRVVYLGPTGSAERLRLVAAARASEAARMPAELRTHFAGRQPLSWPRLSEPRQLVTKIAAQNGWKLAGEERVPYDLWAAGELPELTPIERLTVLLLGFDLTFALRPEERAVEIVALEPVEMARETASSAPSAPKPASRRSTQGKMQVYTLRVQEKPVRAVLRELGQRLHWSIDIDEVAIQAANKSLDTRVTFSVENVDREQLLDALLRPAGLECRIDGNTVRVLPRRYE